MSGDVELLQVNPVLFADFCRFAEAQIRSGDLDPTYPVLREVYAQRGYDLDAALWHTLLYVTFYNLGTAERVFQKYPTPVVVREPLTFPTGIERRGFRGNALANQHVNHLVGEWGAAGGPSAWVERTIGAGGERGWKSLRIAFQRAPYGGNWSSYKWADLVKNVHGFPITADDIGVGGGGATAGPVPGMVRLTGQPWQRCADDVLLQRQLMIQCKEQGVPFDGLDQLETALCDFNSLCKGSYYMGHDIDQQMAQLAGLSQDWWDARRKVFPAQYLGEVGGWDGVRKGRKRAYADRQELLL